MSEPDALRALLEKWRAEAAEIDADGDFCCALTRRHDADALEAVLARVTEPVKTPERWALACKTTVELIGRLNRGADLATEIAEALMTFPAVLARLRDGGSAPQDGNVAYEQHWRAVAIGPSNGHSNVMDGSPFGYGGCPHPECRKAHMGLSNVRPAIAPHRRTGDQ